jgi:hypothetical protein
MIRLGKAHKITAANRPGGSSIPGNEPEPQHTRQSKDAMLKHADQPHEPKVINRKSGGQGEQ